MTGPAAETAVASGTAPVNTSVFNGFVKDDPRWPDSVGYNFPRTVRAPEAEGPFIPGDKFTMYDTQVIELGIPARTQALFAPGGP